MSNGVTDTSLEAYNMIKHLLSERQDQIIKIFVKHKDQSFTNMELAQELGWSINRVTPRTYELRKMGVIHTVGQRPCRVTKHTSYAMELKWIP